MNDIPTVLVDAIMSVSAAVPARWTIADGTIGGTEPRPQDSYLVTFEYQGRSASFRVLKSLFADAIDFGERRIRAELEHEAAKCCAALTPLDGDTGWREDPGSDRHRVPHPEPAAPSEPHHHIAAACMECDLRICMDCLEPLDVPFDSEIKTAVRWCREHQHLKMGRPQENPHADSR